MRIKEQRTFLMRVVVYHHCRWSDIGKMSLL